MERVHRLIAEGNFDAEKVSFWRDNWTHIASAKVPLETKFAAYHTLGFRDAAHVNNLSSTELYEMVLADRQFVAKLDLDDGMRSRYQLFIICLEDDITALARDYPETTNDRYDFLKYARYLIVTEINAPRCIRFLLQDRDFRGWMTKWRLSPRAQRFIEELVQPTDDLCRKTLVWFGQSVKLVGMCVKDGELVAMWLKTFPTPPRVWSVTITVMFARKLHALATPEQRAPIKTRVLDAITAKEPSDGYFELAWLCGLLCPSEPIYPRIRKRFLKSNVDLFPAFTFATVVAMCDGYLEVRSPGRTPSQERFFDLVVRLPMELQELVALKLWGQTATIIPSEKCNRAFLVII
jgi:hypothetical protein